MIKAFSLLLIAPIFHVSICGAQERNELKEIVVCKASSSNLCLPPPDSDGRIATLNHKGKMSPVIDPATAAYLDFISSQPQAHYLDIGCAYGFTVEKALERQAQLIYAIDLEPQHLTIMKQSIDDKTSLLRVTAIAADFPDDAASFDSIPLGSIRGALLARVIHFFEGEKIEKGLDKLFEMLEPGGRIFINVLSSYAGTAEGFLDTFEKNVKQQSTYPGQCNHVKELGRSFADSVEGTFHFFTPETLSALVQKHRFKILKAEYAPLCYSSKTLQRDGRENVILIGQKPML